MQKTIVPFENVSQLSKTDLAYVTGNRSLVPFYKYEINHEAFKKIIEDKSQEKSPRKALVSVLRNQYAGLPSHPLVDEHIAALLSGHTFTVATAHQPCLFLGPLYVLYKAISVINVASAASVLVPGKYKIIPIFVIGSEDHDLLEVNRVSLFSKEVVWQPGSGGAVGSISTATMREALEQCSHILGNTEHARIITERLERAYDGKRTFAQATQALMHDLLGQFGLVVLDMNDPTLKKLFLPVLRSELTGQVSYRLVSQTTQQLNQLGFKTQAAPREINLFYMLPGLRERIVLENQQYRVLNTDLVFTRQQMLQELKAHPDRFSPNVVLRPLYQEMILPNLAYVGGGGELAYWLERKSLFEHYRVNFPLLVRRSSVLLIDRENSKKLQRFGISATRIFEDSEALVRYFIEQHAATEISLSTEIADLQKIFDRIAQKALSLDASLEPAVRADETRFVQAMAHWENRLVRAEKAKHEITLQQIRSTKNRLFPNGELQERVENFLPWYLKYGENLFLTLKEKLLPLERGVIVLEEK